MPRDDASFDLAFPWLGPGTNREEDAALHTHARHVGDEDVRDSAARAGLERLAGERICETVRSYELGQTVQGQQRDELSELSSELALAADHMHECAPHLRVQLQ